MNTINHFRYHPTSRWFIIAFVVLLTVLTACSSSIRPPHNGVFVRQGRDLLELTERELFETPLLGALPDITQIQETQPVLIIWQQDTQLDYLDFYQLGQTKNDRQRIKYNAKPVDDGAFEITPASALSDCEYCLVQGDPLSMFLPGWCFRIGAQESNAPKTVEQEMVLIPAGEFQMGCDPKHNGGFACPSDEQLHTATLEAYRIDKWEVTNAQYAKCVATGSCAAPPSNSSKTRPSYYNNSSYADYPVINVSWQDAVDYCAWAGKRLPSEYEWEKAARGTSLIAYPWGDQVPNCSLANFNDSPKGDAKHCVGDTTAVGSYPEGASAYGVMDLAGNVWEWVNDDFRVKYLTPTPPGDPRERANKRGYVIRGGSWNYSGIQIRVTFRSSLRPDKRDLDLGFRCADNP